MSKAIIPLRPSSGKYNLSIDEMDGLSYYVLSNCPKESVFLKFIRPDFVNAKSAVGVKAAVTQFFSSREVREYIEAYKSTLDEFLNPAKRKIEAPSTPSTASIEERKSKAKTKLVEFAMNLANDIEHADDPEFVLKVADKAGLLDMEENVEEQPRRYLPETCFSCAYRQYCEDNTEDACQYCKYLIYGIQNGVYYDKKEMLTKPLLADNPEEPEAEESQ